MARKAKNIQIDVTELSEEESSVFVNKKKIGSIKQLNPKSFEATVGQSVMNVKSFDDGVEWIISEFNLHEL